MHDYDLVQVQSPNEVGYQAAAPLFSLRALVWRRWSTREHLMVRLTNDGKECDESVRQKVPFDAAQSVGPRFFFPLYNLRTAIVFHKPVCHGGKP